MKISQNVTSDTTIELVIETSGERVEKELVKETSKVRKKITMPGFRKGRVPLDLIKKQYGPQIYSTAVENVINDSFKEAMITEKLDPIAPGNISDVEHDEGKDLKFKATIEVEPDFKVEGIEKIKVEQWETDVTDDMLEESIKKLQFRFASVLTKEEPAELTDHLIVDINEVDPTTKVEIIGRKIADRGLLLGENMFGPDLDEHLVGLNVGDEKIITRDIPADPDEKKKKSLEKEHFKVSIKKVETVSIPEINDDFAKDLGYDDVKGLREGVTKQIAFEFEGNSRKDLRFEIEQEIVKLVNPAAPKSMVDRYLHNMAESIKQYSEKPVDEAKTLEEGKPFATAKIQWYLIKHKLVHQQNITVSDQDIDDYINKFAVDHKTDLTKLKMEYRKGDKRDQLREEIIDHQIFEFIESKIKIKKVKRK